MVVCNVDWDSMEQAGLSDGQQQIQSAFETYGVKDYVVLQKGNVKIAVVGVFGTDALKCAPTCELIFKDPVEAVKETVEEIKKKAGDFDYIVINDCSKDDTKKICEENGFNLINLPINLGIGGAVQTGYKYGYTHGYDLAVQVDGDGQHDPIFLKKMADCMREHNADMVIGSRFIQKEGFQSSGTRRIGIKYFTILIKCLTGKKITDPTSGLRMVNRNVMKMFIDNYPKDYPEPESVVAVLRQGEKVEELPVVMRARSGGVSSISLKKSVYYMIKVSLAIIIERIRK